MFDVFRYVFFFLHSRSISWKPLASLFPPWPPRFDLDWLDDDGDDDEVDVEVADEVVDDDEAVEVLFAEVIDADDAGAVDGNWGGGPWLGTLKKVKQNQDILSTKVLAEELVVSVANCTT